jgi:CarD family transcriptional regulator
MAMKKKPAASKKAPAKAKKPALKTAATKTAPAKAVKKPLKAVAKTAPKAAVKKTAPAKQLASKLAVKAKTPAKNTAPKTAPAKQTAVKAALAKKAPAKLETKTEVAKPVKAPIKTSAPVPTVTAAPTPAKPAEKPEFHSGDYVVYPAHGVGLIEGVETQKIAGIEITLYTIVFEKDRMRLKLPLNKAKASGLRRLSSNDRLKEALSTLQGKSKVRRTMWSRRAQEYEMKINSGDPVSIAEVLRDLRRSDDPQDQSYSERQIYQAALERLAREVAAIEKIDEKKAAEKLENVLGVQGHTAPPTAA